MNAATDMRPVIVAKSDQLTADDLISGPRTITITRVELHHEAEQKVHIFFEGDEGKPYRSCKSMSRVMVHVWGPDAAVYAGRSMTLYRDPNVKWGGMAVGGIRISHMSHMDREQTIALMETAKKKKLFRVLPLVVEKAPEAPEPPRRTVRQFLDDLEAELRECQAWDGLLAIEARDDVRKARDSFVNGAAERLGDMLDAARERLAEKLEQVAKVYDNALKDPDPRVALVAAKQVSVELWGQPTQAVTSEGGGPLTVVLRRFTDAADQDEQPSS
jgi:hypothetical protein